MQTHPSGGQTPPPGTIPTNVTQPTVETNATDRPPGQDSIVGNQGDAETVTDTVAENHELDDEQFWEQFEGVESEEHANLSRELRILRDSVASMLPKDRESMGHTISTMLLSCDFKGDACTPR